MKEKIAKADSSSSDTEDENAPKRKKLITIGDKPTEEVVQCKQLTLAMF